MPELLERRPLRRQISEGDWRTTSTATAPRQPWVLGGFRDSRQTVAFPFLNGELIITLDGSVPPWLPVVVEKLDAIAKLPPNWNSYGAAPVKQSCLHGTIALLLDIMQDRSPAPNVMPTNRGTVLLEWHRRGIDLEIDVLAPGRLHVVAEAPAIGIDVDSSVDADLGKVVQLLMRLS